MSTRSATGVMRMPSAVRVGSEKPGTGWVYSGRTFLSSKHQVNATAGSWFGIVEQHIDTRHMPELESEGRGR